MPKISVLMPCLNVVKYITQCMDSVICQTLTDIEILIIDAGSVDGTLQILHEYMHKDSRIHLIHSDKKSYGYQMNMGISLACGNYIAIVETDDIIQPEMLEVLYQKAVETNADYVKGTSEGFYRESGGMEWRFSILPCKELIKNNEYCAVPKDTPELFLYDNFLWNGIYKTVFMRKIKFNETPGAAFQDIGALFQILSTAQKGVYCKYFVYHYRQDNFNASSYNRKGLMYTAEEYDYTEQFIRKLSGKWNRVYYLKMVGLMVDRFHAMAISGEYWPEAEGGIKRLRERVLLAVRNGLILPEECEDWQKSLWFKLDLFLKSPNSLFEYLKQDYEIKFIRLKEIYETAILHKIYIFGAGKTGQFVAMFLLMKAIKNIIGYCDNNVELQGKSLGRFSVLSPSEAVEKQPDAFYIIAVKNYVHEIKEQMVELGVSEDRIEIYSMGTDTSLLQRKLNQKS